MTKRPLPTGGGRFRLGPDETQLTDRARTGTDRLAAMQTLFDIILVLVALAVVWFASFTVLRLFKGQN